jgi:hypothetical protein
MKKLIVALAAVCTSSCAGGVTPELYAVIVDFFRPGTSCYANNMYPANDVSASSGGSFRVEVYDWSDQGNQKVFLEIVSGGVTVDMGDARPVVLGGLFEGTRATGGDQPTTFVSSRTTERNVNVLGQTAAFVDNASATIAINRGRNVKGTLELKSTTTCTGTACPGTIPQCTIGGVQLRGTQLEVDYEQAP